MSNVNSSFISKYNIPYYRNFEVRIEDKHYEVVLGAMVSEIALHNFSISVDYTLDECYTRCYIGNNIQVYTYLMPRKTNTYTYYIYVPSCSII